MTPTTPTRSEMRVTVAYCLVACLGFAVDLTLLKLGDRLGVAPALTRVFSLFCAMQVTFLVNGLFVFRCLRVDCAHLMWGGYMATNACGNLCNYLVFNTLLSLHRPVLSDHAFAVLVGGLAAWSINYACARLVFRKLATIRMRERDLHR